MGWFEFDWVDAFADRPFCGNGCAVVHGGAGLPDETCMAFVRETSLVECTFTGLSDVADIHVRYFVANREIPFAGHPTIATVAAIRSRGLMKSDEMVLETGAGLVPVRIHEDEIEMTQVAPEFRAMVPPELVAQAIGLGPEAIIAPPQIVSSGLPFCITLLRDREALDAALLDLDGLRRLAKSEGYSGMPFLVTLTGATDAGDTYARLLLRPPGRSEDPFTGSATGAMAAYLWHHDLMAKDTFIAEQGHGMGRPGRAMVTRVGPAEAMTGIRVAGSGFVLMRGQADLPTAGG